MKLKIEIFSSPGCGKCGHAKQLLENMVNEMDEGNIEWRDVNILEELDYAVNLGILSTPAIVINGELIFNRLPSAKKLRQTLETRIKFNKKAS